MADSGHLGPMLHLPRTRRPISLLLRRGSAFCSGLRIALLLGMTSTSLRAEETSAENKAAARDLALQGIQLAQNGQCAEAINPLSRAEDLYHAPTILTWIGQCQIELGQLVEGTETLNRVVRERTSADSPEAYIQAKQKAARLIETTRPKIAKLTIVVTPSDIQDLVLSVGDKKISNALVGAPRPTDPGRYVVTVSAPGYKEAKQEIEVAAGAKESLNFELEALAMSAAPPPNEGSDSSAQARTPESIPWVGWTLVGLGGALVGAGGVTGYLAISKKNDLDCPNKDSCAPSQQDTLDAARRNALLSTVFFGVGAAAATTGVIFLVMGVPREPQAEIGHLTLTPRIGLGSAGFSGTF